VVVDITVGNGIKHTEVVRQLQDVCQKFMYKSATWIISLPVTLRHTCGHDTQVRGNGLKNK
jgi:hypothetical protein